jgi:hypothetical protein
VAQVYQAMDRGDRFFTRAGTYTAHVNKYYCPNCKVSTLISSPDATTANNLDNLQRC